VVLTDHDAFDFAMVSRKARFVLDCRHRLVGANVEYL
jgi:UDP-N-acetyl-D-glucosamine dehydrogenase